MASTEEVREMTEGPSEALTRAIGAVPRHQFEPPARIRTGDDCEPDEEQLELIHQSSKEQGAERPDEDSGEPAPQPPGMLRQPQTPAEELQEYERALQKEAAHVEPGAIVEGAEYYVISRRWLVEWRQWVGHPSVQKRGHPISKAAPGTRERRTRSEDAAAVQGRRAHSDSASPSACPEAFPGQHASANRPGSPVLFRRNISASTTPGSPLLRSWTRDRPGPIDNFALFEASNPEALRPGLSEHYDFEIVSAAVWELYHGWYRGGPPVRRRAIRLSSGEVQIELHMLRLRFCSYLDHSLLLELEVSRVATVGELKRRVCQQLGHEESAMRLLHRADESTVEGLVGREASTVEECHILESQVILLEERRPDGTWPSDAPASQEEPAAGQEEDVDMADPFAMLAGMAADEPPSAAPSMPWVDPEPAETTEDPCPESHRPPEGGTTVPAGMRNLGNTCYMNSSIQCLANIPALKDYFLKDTYRDALEIDGQKTEHTGGEIASGFAGLLHKIWSASRTIAPWQFKDLVARYRDTFSGYRQHDSMEFIEFLIDSLKEDCNKIKGKKLYVERPDSDGRPDVEVALEAANKFLLRNDSEIDDLFVGFFKCCTVCPEASCHKESVVFDPFLSVKLPVVNPKCSTETVFVVNYVPTQPDGAPVTKLNVPVKKFGSVEDLIEAAAGMAGVADPTSCVLAEVYGHVIHKLFEDADKLEFINSEDVLVLYELEDAEAFKMTAEQRWGSRLQEGDVVSVTTTFRSNSRKAHVLTAGQCGRVCHIDSDDDAQIQFDDVEEEQWVFKRNFTKLAIDPCMSSSEKRQLRERELPYTFREFIEEHHLYRPIAELRELWFGQMKVVGEDVSKSGLILQFRVKSPATGKRELFGIPLVCCVQRGITLFKLVDAIRSQLSRRCGCDVGSDWRLWKRTVLLWDGESDDDDISMTLDEREYLLVEWEDGIPSQMQGLVADAESDQPDAGPVTLEKCFEWMTEVEQLSEEDAVYCSGCKEHRQCFKRIQVWSLPPVVVLQLKRLEYTGVQCKRISTPVSFPTEGLDLGRFCLSQGASFPPGRCLRVGQKVKTQGLKSAQFNEREGIVMKLDCPTGRFCIQFEEGAPLGDCKKIEPQKLVPIADEPGVTAPPPLYDLAAVTKHIGNASYGHYVAYARSCTDGKWRLFDDDEVREVSAQDVEAQQTGAYLLFYIRRDLRPGAWEPPC